MQSIVNKAILNKVEKNDHIFGVIDSYSGPTSTKNLTKAIDFIVKNKFSEKKSIGLIRHIPMLISLLVQIIKMVS